MSFDSTATAFEQRVISLAVALGISFTLWRTALHNERL